MEAKDQKAAKTAKNTLEYNSARFSVSKILNEAILVAGLSCVCGDGGRPESPVQA